MTAAGAMGPMKQAFPNITPEDLLRAFTGIEHKPTIQESTDVKAQAQALLMLERFLQTKALKQTAPATAPKVITTREEVLRKLKKGEDLTPEDERVLQETRPARGAAKEKDYDKAAENMLKNDLNYALMFDPKERAAYRQELINELKRLAGEEPLEPVPHYGEIAGKPNKETTAKKDPKGLR
jgi:hypothetical protein